MEDLSMILAIGQDGAIGKDGALIWDIPGDLPRFKALTMGHPVIMGRKTWDSLPKKPLPGRRNIILSRRKDFKAEGAEIVSSPQEALSLTKNQSPFIIGGAEIYKAFLPYASRLYLTYVEATCPEADTFLPLDLSSWRDIEASPLLTSPSGLSFRFLTLLRQS